MTSAEKILAGIASEAEQAAAQKIDEANVQAQQILDNAKKTAQQIAAAAETDAQKKAAVITATGKSSAALIVRDVSLTCRREIIDQVLVSAAEQINSLPDAQYFDFLAAVAVRSGCATGEMLLSAQDARRDTAVLREKLAATGIRLSAQTADINGGFILKNGEIEINASIDALIHEKRGELVDSVNRILFS